MPGRDDYLPKPFHAEELVARLGAIVRRTGGHLTPSSVSVRSASTQGGSRVSVDGQAISLSRRSNSAFCGI